MRLLLTVEHGAGTVDLDTRDPFLLEAAADAFRAFAFAADENTEIKVPSSGEPVLLKAGDIDCFDVAWEA